MILLQIYFEIEPDKAKDFETMYAETYVPAMKKQQGYQGSTLLRLFPPEVCREIESADTEFNYQMELVFDTEENRRKWVASEEHQVAWPRAQQMAQSVAYRGYDLVGCD